jgi:hypothetical protein
MYTWRTRYATFIRLIRHAVQISLKLLKRLKTSCQRRQRRPSQQSSYCQADASKCCIIPRPFCCKFLSCQKQHFAMLTALWAEPAGARCCPPVQLFWGSLGAPGTFCRGCCWQLPFSFDVIIGPVPLLIILQWIFKKWDGGHGLDWYGSG